MAASFSRGAVVRGAFIANGATPAPPMNLRLEIAILLFQVNNRVCSHLGDGKLRAAIRHAKIGESGSFDSERRQIGVRESTSYAHTESVHLATAVVDQVYAESAVNSI